MMRDGAKGDRRAQVRNEGDVMKNLSRMWKTIERLERLRDLGVVEGW